jgi:hypothetical protein
METPEEYVRGALTSAASAFEPDSNAIAYRVATGRDRSGRVRRALPVAAAAAVAVILSLSVLAIRGGGQQPVAAPPAVLPSSSARAEPSPSPVQSSPRSRLPSPSLSPSFSPSAAGSPRSQPNLAAAGATDPASGPVWSQQNVTLTTTRPVHALTVTIRIARTRGAAEAGRFTTAPNDDIAMTATTGSGALTYTYALKKGRTLQPGAYVFAAQFTHADGRGPEGDAFTVTAEGEAGPAGTFS